MKTTKGMLKGFLFLAITTMLFSFDEPKGWFKAGSAPKSYDMGIDKGAGQDGVSSFDDTYSVLQTSKKC